LIHYTKTLKGAGQIQGGAGQTLGGANAPPRPPLKETLRLLLMNGCFVVTGQNVEQRMSLIRNVGNISAHDGKLDSSIKVKISIYTTGHV